MKIVIYSDVLNQHQAPVADELWNLTNHQFCFVEQTHSSENKGGKEDYSLRPYLLRAWSSQADFKEAMKLTRTADCCIFAGVSSLPFEKERLKLNLLSLEMGERWLKHGVLSLASPRLLKWLFSYYVNGWRHKDLYKLCCSGFCKQDHYRLGSFKNKCYKWGYFTKVEDVSKVEAPKQGASTLEITPLMWCARFLRLKHPELPVLLAQRLRDNGYKFHISMYGTGELEKSVISLSEKLGVTDLVSFHGAVSNDQVHDAMKESCIFLFTSDRYEGWGAVSNESMSEGCVLVASSSIGSVPFLVEDGINGLTFKSPRPSSSMDSPDIDALNDLSKKVSWLLDNPEKVSNISAKAKEHMNNVWSPQNAASNLIKLIDSLKSGKDTPIEIGPCSKA